MSDAALQMPMSNRHVRVVSRGKKALAAALSLLDWGHAKGWAIKDKALVLYWAERQGISMLPYELKGGTLVNFVWDWLEQADRGDEPDHDGSNTPDGFDVATNEYGQGPDGWQSLCGIRAIWAEQGK